jgi:sphinganine-1-phosphate aldolase
LDTFIADLKDSIEEAKHSKSGEDGTMVGVYGLGGSSTVEPGLVGEMAASFIDALYKA